MIIILIISSNSEKYNIMENIWRKYMNKYNNVKCYFIKFNNDNKNNIYINENENTIYLKGKESLIPGILIKTIKSIEYFIKKKINFDYIIRTNLSSVINLKILNNFLNKNNIKIGGYIMNSLKYKNFLSGICIILNKEVCNYLINNLNNIDYNIPDDVSLSYFVNKKYKYININKININKNIIDKINYINLNNFIIYRCKSNNNHDNTINYMNFIINKIYNV